MALPAKKEEVRCSFADSLTWDENERIEIIEGEVYMMAPPARAHQKASGEIFRQIANYLDGKEYEIYSAPFAVRLFEKDGDRPEDVDTMVEPDISVVCDRSRLDHYGCKGAPDMIVEVLSPSTRRRDRLVKLELYQRAGVREYWIVNPEDRTVQVMLLDGNGLLRIHEDYGQEDAAQVTVLEDCVVDLRKVFAG